MTARPMRWSSTENGMDGLVLVVDHEVGLDDSDACFERLELLLLLLLMLIS